MAPTNEQPTPPLTRHTGAILRAKRRQRHMTYKTLSERLGQRGVKASIGFLSDIEKGRREPASLDFVVAVEDMLGIPAETWAHFESLSRFLELRRAS